MKKFVFFPEEIIAQLLSGKCVAGSLRVDSASGKIVFHPYRRSSRQRVRDKLLKVTPHGWLKESALRYKFYTSVKKDMATLDTCDTLNQDMSEAVEGIIEAKTRNVITGNQNRIVRDQW